MNEKMKPSAGEYHPYYQGYLDALVNLDWMHLYSSQIEEVEELFRGKDETWSTKSYAEGKWSPKELLAHITDTDRVMAYRAFCFARGEQAELPGFDQDIYIANGLFNQLPVKVLLDDFKLNRQAVLSMIQTIGKDNYLKKGIANGTEVSVRALLAIIPGHAAHHLRILKERY